ncbi:hypothetical protein E0V38_23585 [Salmonella enterica subsp. enterica serovar Newport]|nr:hypothetical protein [Salmonella enterica subsp. enterica serovar Newport]
MEFQTGRTRALTDTEKRTAGAFDNFIIYLTAAVVVWFLLNALFYFVWSPGDIPVPVNELWLKDMLNVLMYVIPLSFAGIAAGNVAVILLNDILTPLAEITVYGLSVLLRKITRRGKSHE